MGKLKKKATQAFWLQHFPADSEPDMPANDGTTEDVPLSEPAVAGEPIAGETMIERSIVEEAPVEHGDIEEVGEVTLPSCPYLSPIISVLVGPSETVFRVHSDIFAVSDVLRARCEPRDYPFRSVLDLELPDTKPSVFELVLCHLYGGDYQEYFSVENPKPTKANAVSMSLERHSMLHCFALKYDIQGLETLTEQRIIGLGEVDYWNVFAVAKEAYKQLTDKDSFFRKYFREQTRKALAENRGLMQEAAVHDYLREESGNLTVDLFTVLTQAYDQTALSLRFPRHVIEDDLREGGDMGEQINTDEIFRSGSKKKGKKKLIKKLRQVCDEIPIHRVVSIIPEAGNHECPDQADHLQKIEGKWLWESCTQCLLDRAQMFQRLSELAIATPGSKLVDYIGKSLVPVEHCPDTQSSASVGRTPEEGEGNSSHDLDCVDKDWPTTHVAEEPVLDDFGASPDAADSHKGIADDLVECGPTTYALDDVLAMESPVVVNYPADDWAPAMHEVVGLEGSEHGSPTECPVVENDYTWGMFSKPSNATKKSARKAQLALETCGAPADDPPVEDAHLNIRPDETSSVRKEQPSPVEEQPAEELNEGEGTRCRRRSFHLLKESRWIQCRKCRAELSKIAREQSAVQAGWNFTKENE